MLLDPLNYDFMRCALTISVLVGILCPIVGSYLIVQRMALLGDVIAHAVLPGLAIAHFIGIEMLIGAFSFGILSTFVISWIRSQSRVSVDAAMAITFASFFGLGITLLTLFRSRLDLLDLLFGDILSVTWEDVGRTAIISVAILVCIKLFYKELLFFTFDRVGAEASGLPVQWINLGMMAGITLTLIAGMKIIGVVLVVSLMVGPATTAYLLVKELHWMMILGAAISVRVMPAIMQQVFADLKQQGKTLLICSHEWGDSLYRYDRLLLLNQKLLADDQPQAVMTLENIQRAYGENVQSRASKRSEVPFFC